MAKCIRCRADLVVNARFCASCGTPVAVTPGPTITDDAAKVSTADPFAKTQPEQSSRPKGQTKPPPGVSPLASSFMHDPTAAVAAVRAPSNPDGSAALRSSAAPQPSPAPARASAAPTPPAASPVHPLAPPPPQAPSQPHQRAAQAQYFPAQPAQPAGPGGTALMPGALVLVHWTDGNKYPGTVLQVSAYHALVAFPNGTQQWVELRRVSAGG